MVIFLKYVHETPFLYLSLAPCPALKNKGEKNLHTHIYAYVDPGLAG